MKIHVLGLPHTQVSKAYLSCAYTQKILKFARMMPDVILYASEDNETPAELVTCISRSEQFRFGFEGPADYLKNTFDSSNPLWQIFHQRAISALARGLEPGDIICTFSGRADQPVAAAFVGTPFVEAGIGYSGVFSDYRVYESHAWRHTVMGGLAGDAAQANGRFFDTVIPNYFDPADFTFEPNKDNYFLYLGRLTDRKGWRIAQDVCARQGLRLIVAGPGDFNGYGEYVGMVGEDERRKLLSHAQAAFVPTLYVEPFGGVHVEAMLSGTPVITTPWGAFTETFEHGIHGFRCTMFDEFLTATRLVQSLDPAKIRDHAMSRFSTSVVAVLYKKYFRQLATLSGEGWYQVPFQSE